MKHLGTKTAPLFEIKLVINQARESGLLKETALPYIKEVWSLKQGVLLLINIITKEVSSYKLSRGTLQ